MTFIGQHLPELVPFMEDTYSPQAVNQARNAFKKKVRKSSATFFYGAMCGFFTTDELDDLLFEASEVARFLLEVEGTTLDIDEEIDIEDRITRVMRGVGEVVGMEGSVRPWLLRPASVWSLTSRTTPWPVIVTGLDPGPRLQVPRVFPGADAVCDELTLRSARAAAGTANAARPKACAPLSGEASRRRRTVPSASGETGTRPAGPASIGASPTASAPSPASMPSMPCSPSPPGATASVP
mgnify:CR=1 FL=1